MAIEKDRERLLDAMERSFDWHRKDVRKETTIPYWSHLIQVAGLVLEHGGDADQAIAALFHDSLEDAPSPKKRAKRERVLRKEFGKDVLGMVLGCTDTEEEESAAAKAPWRLRKERYLKHLAEADPRTTLVAACDKRHNLGAMLGDARVTGPGFWDRFNAPLPDQVWYYEGALAAVESKIPPRLYGELARLVAELRELAKAAQPA